MTTSYDPAAARAAMRAVQAGTDLADGTYLLCFAPNARMLYGRYVGYTPAYVTIAVEGYADSRNGQALKTPCAFVGTQSFHPVQLVLADKETLLALFRGDVRQAWTENNEVIYESVRGRRG